MQLTLDKYMGLPQYGDTCRSNSERAHSAGDAPRRRYRRPRGNANNAVRVGNRGLMDVAAVLRTHRVEIAREMVQRLAHGLPPHRRSMAGGEILRLEHCQRLD